MKFRSSLNMKKVIMKLLHSSTNAHILHLQSRKYSEHVALGEYYQGIVGHVDKLVETLQGLSGDIITKYPLENDGFKEGMNTLDYIVGIREFFTKNRKSFPRNSEIQNILDEIMELLNTTVYKLKFLN